MHQLDGQRGLADTAPANNDLRSPSLPRRRRRCNEREGDVLI
jgi:hypothetical protein